MDTNHQPLVSEPLRSTAIPIAQLAPDVDNLEKRSVHSVITLIWPYSSSTKSLSLLLAEPDFRLRRSNGQVKVTFHGNVAEEVARSHVGIGDKVFLSLAGSRLDKNDAVAQTPGKGVSWDVHFNNSAMLEVWRDSKLLSVVKFARSETPPPEPDNIVTTPIAKGVSNTPAPLSSTSWQSPAFLGRSWASLGFSNASFDPFAEEDGYVPGKGRKRPRFSMQSKEWRVIDQPESPSDRDLPEDWMTIFDEELATGSDVGDKGDAQNAVTSVNPPIPATASAAPAADTDVSMVDTLTVVSDTVTQQPTARANDDTHFARLASAQRHIPEPSKQSPFDHAPNIPTDTPHLLPVPSLGLSDPSPLNTTANNGYFPSSVDAAVAVQTAVSTVPVPDVVSESRDSITPPQVGSEGGAVNVSEDDVVTVYTDDVEVLPDDVSASANPISSPHASYSKVTRSVATMADEIHAPERDESPPVEVDAGSPPSQGDSEESGSESESGSEDDRVTPESIDYPNSERVLDRRKDEQLFEQASVKRENEGDRMSVTRSVDEESDAEIVEPVEDNHANPVQNEMRSPERPGDVSDDTGHHPEYEYGDDEGSGSEEYYQDDDEDGMGTGGYGTENQGEYEEVFEVDEQEDRADRAEAEYDDSESEVEAGYEEKHYLQSKPKNAAPEIIVLDSDSEDEVSAQRPNNAAGRDIDEMSVSEGGDSYVSEEDYPEGEVDDAEVHDNDFEEDQEVDEDRQMKYEEEEEEEEEEESENQGRPDEFEAGREVDGPQKLEYEEEQELGHENRQNELEESQEVDGDEAMEYTMDDELEYDNNGNVFEEDRGVDDDREVDEEEEDLARGDKGDDRPSSERLAGEWLPGSEQAGRDTQHAHYNDLVADHLEGSQKRSKPVTEPTPVEDPNAPQQSPVFYEYPAPDESQGFQPAVDHAPGPDHDSLDYLATISETVERIHTHPSNEPGSYAMAIDPSLYEPRVPPSNIVTKADLQHGPRERSVEVDNAPRIDSSESRRISNLALQLDGAISPPEIDSTEVVHTSIHYHARQLVTPGPSQPTEIIQAPVSPENTHEMPPTPNLTQDASTSVLGAYRRPSTPLKTTLFEIQDDVGHPRPTKDEPISPVVKREDESEVEAPMVVVDTHPDALSDEDQRVQVSIEADDETEDGTPNPTIDRNYPGLRSKLSYFAPLATLVDHYNASVDAIAIATETRPVIKATTGKKDFILTLQLTDQSMAGTTLYAQILRPYKPALPTLQEGDAILLRNFCVKSFDHSVILVSDSTSAWAVFSASSNEPQINGPPVEFGDEEETFATDLRQWYIEGGAAMVADYQLQASVGRESRGATPASSLAPSDAGSIDMALREARGDTSSSRGSRRRKSGHRRITIHELRDGRRYTEVGSSPGEDSIHELRDGTVYANG